MALYWQPIDSDRPADVDSGPAPARDARRRVLAHPAVVVAAPTAGRRHVGLEPLIAVLAAGVIGAAMFFLFAASR